MMEMDVTGTEMMVPGSEDGAATAPAKSSEEHPLPALHATPRRSDGATTQAGTMHDADSDMARSDALPPAPPLDDSPAGQSTTDPLRVVVRCIS